MDNPQCLAALTNMNLVLRYVTIAGDSDYRDLL